MPTWTTTERNPYTVSESIITSQMSSMVSYGEVHVHETSLLIVRMLLAQRRVSCVHVLLSIERNLVLVSKRPYIISRWYLQAFGSCSVRFCMDDTLRDYCYCFSHLVSMLHRFLVSLFLL